MKLIMSGGGESENFVELDQHFLSLLPANPTLLLIPMAGDPSTFDDALDRIVETFSKIHFDTIEMMLDLQSLDWGTLKEFDAIYIDGGNTFRLMDQVRRSHFYELLRKFIHKGGVINGDSAGAIILGSHLETAHFGEDGDDNETELVSYQGLNLLGDIAIHCHYEESEKDQIAEFVNEYGLPVIALHETTGVAIEDFEMKVIGSAKAELYFEGNRVELRPGESMRLKDEPHTRFRIAWLTSQS
ncbi:MAG: Type 1 glutamine amidotransferase-like domain-containing protein [Bdellovibrionales bacterium]|nr:Type 1 glutamine amidotransferase-like domain-containing protein [Bdellovibrionales bacterium]